MSSLCCCRGLLSFFGVRGYPLDVVATAKLERAKVNKTGENDYSSTENRNGSVVNSEPKTDLSDISRASSMRSRDKMPKRRPTFRDSVRSTTSRKQRRRRRAQSYDDSDSDSSIDSAEESIEIMRRSIHRQHHEKIASLEMKDDGGEEVKEGNGENQSVKEMSPQKISPGHSLVEMPPSPSPSRSPRKISAGASQRAPDAGQNGTATPRISSTGISPELKLGESGTTEFTYDDVSAGSQSPRAEDTSSRGRGSREFKRRTIRKKSPSQSMGSRRSLDSVPESKWDVDVEGSIYGKRQSDSSMPSDEDELATERRRAKRREGSGIETTTDDDEEYQGHGMEPISACGTLDVAVQYSVSDKKLQVTIIEAHDLPSKARGGSSIVQVKAVVLPEKKKKYKTKVQHISSPRFAETFKLSHASPEDLKGLALRLRMYGIGKLKDRLIGEAIIRFDELNLIRDPQLTIQLQLEPRTNINRGDSETSLSNIGSSSSSMMSLSHGGSPPELLVGLSYSAPTGRLCVEIIKGSHFRNFAMAKPPDTFVKLSLLNSACQEMSQSKTTIRRGQPNPVYKETFFFQVALFQLGEVTLMVSVFNKRTIKKKEMIGWVAMGRNSSSDIDEQHWHEMKEGKGQQVCRWHALIDT